MGRWSGETTLRLEIVGLLFRKSPAQPRGDYVTVREKGGCECGRLIIRVVLGRSDLPRFRRARRSTDV